jgi:hypothetical protein
MNIKHKLLNCNANIHFIRMCIDLKLVPKYAKTKIISHNIGISQHVTNKIHEIRVKNEIKFWYKKKQLLNKQLYDLHLENGRRWGKTWDILDKNISHKLEVKMRGKYNTNNAKNR